MNKISIKNKLPLLLLILSAFTHFLFFGQPQAVVFDEFYNGTFVSSYSTGRYYFDIHPPLPKLLSKFAFDAIGAPNNIDFGAIGNKLPWEIVMLRLIPLLAGLLLPLIVYFICRNLNISKIGSFTAGSLIILENSLLTQSRFILFDSLLLLFGFSAVLVYLIYTKNSSEKNNSRKSLLVSSAVLIGLAVSVKWTGLAFPLLIFLAEIFRTKNFKNSVKFFLTYAIIGSVLYMSIFAVHFSYLKYSGSGDAFMSERFQKTLINNPNADNPAIEPKGFFGKFIELNMVMYEANKNLKATHYYSSPWYGWPLMLRPIFYWQDAGGGAYIYLIGNPFIYWLGSLAVKCLFFYCLSFLYKTLRKKNKIKDKAAPLFILLGFIVNFLPFAFIGRIMFLYHYEAALVFSIMAIAFFIDKIKVNKNKIAICSAVILVSLALFVFFSPLSYGLPLSDKQLNSRMWFTSWR